MKDISPATFVEALQNGAYEDHLIIDVREPYEWDYYHLDEAQLMPMNSIPGRLQELPQDKDLYIICAHGVRSRMVCGFLLQQGFERVVNVEGGMAAVAELRGFAYD